MSDTSRFGAFPVAPHSQPAAACLAALDAHPDGLTGAGAGRRLAEHGPNRLPEVRARGPVLRFLLQFHNVLVYVLLGAAVVTGALQHWVDTGVILAVVLANAIIGFVQEGKAEAAMAAIRGMLARRGAGHGGWRRTGAGRHRAAGGGRQGARRPADHRSARIGGA